MRLNYAFTATAAEFTPADGRVWVLGGDYDTVSVPAFPVSIPSITVVMKFLLEPSECEIPHNLRVELLDSDGNRVREPFIQTFASPRNQAAPGRAAGSGFVLNMPDTLFGAAGDYSFRILVDDHELGSIPLHMEPA